MCQTIWRRKKLIILWALNILKDWCFNICLGWPSPHYSPNYNSVCGAASGFTSVLKVFHIWETLNLSTCAAETKQVETFQIADFSEPKLSKINKRVFEPMFRKKCVNLYFRTKAWLNWHFTSIKEEEKKTCIFLELVPPVLLPHSEELLLD